eukprot:164042-Pelagomonas_calceolata.AAC.2
MLIALLFFTSLALACASDVGGQNTAPEHEKRAVKAGIQKQFAAQDAYNQLNSRINALISSKAQSASGLGEHEPEHSVERHLQKQSSLQRGGCQKSTIKTCKGSPSLTARQSWRKRVWSVRTEDACSRSPKNVWQSLINPKTLQAHPHPHPHPPTPTYCDYGKSMESRDQKHFLAYKSCNRSSYCCLKEAMESAEISIQEVQRELEEDHDKVEETEHAEPAAEQAEAAAEKHAHQREQMPEAASLQSKMQQSPHKLHRKQGRFEPMKENTACGHHPKPAIGQILAQCFSMFASTAGKGGQG